MKKNIRVIIGLSLIVVLIGVSFAWFNYYQEGNNQKLVAGDIYLLLTEHGDSILLENALPETAGEARARNDNYIDFTITGRNTSPKDVYYQIELLNGTDNGTKRRLNPEDLAFDLYSLNDQNEETLLLDAVSYEDLNNHKIWVDYVEKDTTTEITKKYRLRMWLAQKIVYGEGYGVKYTVDEFKNSFASVKIAVNGNLEEKSFPLKYSYDDTNKRFLMTVWNDYFTRDDGIAADDNVVVRISDPNNRLLFTYEDNNGTELYTNQQSLQLPYSFNINKIINGTLKVSNIAMYGSDVKFEVLKNNVVVQSFIRTVYDENSTDKGVLLSTITYNMPDGTTQTQNLYSGITNYIDVLVDNNGFLGWSTIENGPVEYHFGNVINFASNKTLYPVIRELTLVEIMRKDAVMDNVASEYVSASTGIDFGEVSSDTNGKGVYIRAGTENDTYPILYYRGAVEDNNVVFNNKCWKAVRTTDTGGVKLIYNGETKPVYSSGTPLEENEYTILTNTDNVFSYTSSDPTGWAAIIENDGTYDFEFSIDDSNYLFDLSTALNTDNSTITVYINDNIIGNFPAAEAIIQDFPSENVGIGSVSKIKISVNANGISSTNPLGVGIGLKKEEQGELLSENGCDNTGDDSLITLDGENHFAFSGTGLDNSPAYVGYMYGTVYPYSTSNWTSGARFGSSFTWDGTNYKLVDATVTNPDATHHYSCNSADADATCTDLRYVHYTYTYNSNVYKCYITLTGGDGVEKALEKMQTNITNSNAKDKIDTWYASNMNTVTNKLEDTVWCNDRSIGKYNGWSATGSWGTDLEDHSILYGAYERSNYASESSTTKNQPSLACTNKNDAFTVSNGNGNQKLQYPVALLTSDEMVLAGGLAGMGSQFYLNNGSTDYWSLSPSLFEFNYARGFHTSMFLLDNYVSDTLGLRPSVSLKPGTSVISGDGTVTSPYIIGN